MKKKVLVVICLLFAFGMTACAGGSGAEGRITTVVETTLTAPDARLTELLPDMQPVLIFGEAASENENAQKAISEYRKHLETRFDKAGFTESAYNDFLDNGFFATQIPAAAAANSAETTVKDAKVTVTSKADHAYSFTATLVIKKNGTETTSPIRGSAQTDESGKIASISFTGTEDALPAITAQ